MTLIGLQPHWLMDILLHMMGLPWSVRLTDGPRDDEPLLQASSPRTQDEHDGPQIERPTTEGSGGYELHLHVPVTPTHDEPPMPERPTTRGNVGRAVHYISGTLSNSYLTWK